MYRTRVYFSFDSQWLLRYSLTGSKLRAYCSQYHNLTIQRYYNALTITRQEKMARYASHRPTKYTPK